MPSKSKSKRTVPVVAAHSSMRGLYVKIARELGVHPSYVSRVARGERQSAVVAGALHREFTYMAGKMANMLTAYLADCPPDTWIALANIQVAVGAGRTKGDAFEQSKENGYLNPTLIRTDAVDGSL
jgi:hypothetical protein